MKTYDFVDNYFYRISLNDEDNYSKKAKDKAFSVIIPLIMDNELSEKQKLCIKYKYFYGKNQKEIAEKLHLTQPTVSRHIAVAKETLNSNLKYCWAAMTTAINEYDRLGA